MAQAAIDLDAELPAIGAGDADAFARWLAGAERPLRDGLRQFAALVDTEAVLQETLLRVWQTAPRLVSDGKPNTLLRFGVRVARNLVIDELRRTRPELDEDAVAREAVTQPAMPDPILARNLRECRDQLPAKPRAALEARLNSAGGDDDHVLAARLKMQRNTFLQNFTRARKLLEDCLRGRGLDLGELLAAGGGGSR